MKNLLYLFSLLSFTIAAQTPCENGFSNGFPCNQVSFYSRLTPEELHAPEHNNYNLNDIWGWTDLETGKEYALVGVSDGVTFVDITDPLSPKVIGKLNEPETADQSNTRTSEVQHGKSSWRDIKTFSDHAFIVSDANAQHGMQVFDLTMLREHDGTAFQEFSQDGFYDGVNSAHNIVINEETGYAYIVGATTGDYCNQGGLHILDINDPKNPEYVACFDDDGYTHDAQCVIYQGPDTEHEGMEICFNSNEDTFTIVEVNDKENISMLSRTSYEQVGYSHQGWLTEDHRFFLMNDESDEVEFRYNARTLIWDVQDLDDPQFIGTYFNNEPAIDHNLYTHNGLVYESNYLSGLRILSTDRIENGQLREIAHFDTYAEVDVIAYGGNWSNYPYFESGVIVASDMTEGLYLLKLDTTARYISEHPASQTLCEGATLTMNATSDVENPTYQWQYFDGKDYKAINGKTSQTLEMVATEELNEKRIRCVISDETGNKYFSYTASYELTGTLPDPDFSFTFEDNTVTFLNESSNATSYLWDFGDGNTSDETNPIHEYDQLDNYQVSLTAYNDCGEESLTLETLIVTGIDQFSSNVKIYPNPVSDLLQIEYNQPYTFTLFHSATGKMLLKESATTNSQVILSNYPPGLYLLKLEIEGERPVIRKIVIH